MKLHIKDHVIVQLVCSVKCSMSRSYEGGTFVIRPILACCLSSERQKWRI